MAELEQRCREAACRACGRSGLQPILDLGRMPHSDGLLAADQLDRPEPRYPLELAFCPDCTLVQILETVAPEVLFGADYPYFSSYSETWLEHCRQNAAELIAARSLGPESLVVEVASNDGYLLKNFVEAGIPVLGIDPAPGPAAAAERAGVPTLQAFFGAKLAAELQAQGKSADVLLANNVLAHVADTRGFVAGLRELLAGDGLLVIEFPYLRDLVDGGQFDTIYHQHLCYFSLRSADALLRRHGLYTNDVRRLPTHGGSLRLYVEPVERVGASVGALLDEERACGLHELDYYRDFAARVRDIRQRLRELLGGLRQQGARIAAYGAAAKGTILLNYTGLDGEWIDYVVDRNEHKHGRFVPGVRLPIHGVDELQRRPPDYLLILPWNLTGEIVAQQRAFAEGGGRFVVPIPEPRVL